MRKPVLALLLAGLVSTGASAAQIRATPDGECPLELSGPIGRGDANELAGLIDATGIASYDADSIQAGEQSICLNSNGGSFSEGLEIANLLRAKGIGTRVTAGSRCFSACAVIFMAGYITGAEFDGSYRYLSVRGRLGFHAPYVEASNRSVTFTIDELEKYYDDANRITAKFIEFASRRTRYGAESLVKVSLIKDLLETPRDALVLVDTIEKAARWEVRLYGYRVREPGSQQSFLTQACTNFMNWNKDLPSSTVAEQEATERWRGEQDGYNVVDFSGEADKFCRIKFYGADDLAMNVCVEDGFSGIDYGRCPEYDHFIFDYYGLPPDTPLSSLAE